MEWLDCMEREFFADDLHKRLTEFLKGKGILDGDDPDKWERLFECTREWRGKYMKNSEELSLNSYFAWNISVTAAEFEIPEAVLEDPDIMPDIMKELFLAVWLLDIDSDEEEKRCICKSGFEFEFECDLQYPKEKCARLTGEQLSKELRKIYNKSYDSLRRYKKDKGHNPEFVEWVEPNYPALMRYIEEFERNEGIEAVRLNKFDDCDRYVWYIAKNGGRITFLQISDFA